MRYVAHFNKDYRTLDDFNYRRELFEHTEGVLCTLSEQLRTQTVGHNKFSDWASPEIDVLLGLRATAEDIERMRDKYARFDTDYVDEEIDWVDRGAVTHVRDQGYCGSSWAHAAVAAIEGAHFVATDELVELSTQ